MYQSEVNYETQGPGGPKLEGGISFDSFVNTVTPVSPTQGPIYDFTADWSKPTANIPCFTWMHIGLAVDETCNNIFAHLQAAWTKDGVDPGHAPIYGFEVRDGLLTPEVQKIRITNDSGVYTKIDQMDLLVLSKEEGAAFSFENLNTDYFSHHSYAWTSVPSSMLPAGGVFDTNSLFDVELGALGLTLGPSQVLLSRQLGEYTGGSTDHFWNFDLHTAHEPEPSTLVLLITAGISLLVFAWRRRR